MSDTWLEALGKCSARPSEVPIDTPGHCAWCGKGLVGRQRRWCSDECPQQWGRHHWWTTARAIALEAAQDDAGVPRCAICRIEVATEVNHKEPRNGQGYGAGCWNHQENLEALCHGCHAVITAQQARARAAERKIA